VPYAASTISESKPMTKRLLAGAGVEVPMGKAFPTEKLDALFDFADSIPPSPLIVKPGIGCRGRGVRTGIESLGELAEAVASIRRECGSDQLPIERQFSGARYRIFVTRDGAYAAVHCDPAHIWRAIDVRIRKLAAYIQ
jgi:biotin carboxylase